MLRSYVVGLVAIVAMVVAWVGVQSVWRRVFPDAASDPDALAGRMGCHDCGDSEGCWRRAEKEEESR